jgi:MFS family permease
MLALLVSVLGDAAYDVALAGALLLHHHSAVFSLSLAGQVLGGTLMLPFAGVIVDRRDRLHVMMTANLVQAVVVLAAYAVLLSGVLQAIPAVSLLLGAASAFFVPAVGAFLPQLVDSGDLTVANALRSLSGKVSSLLGPSLAGVVLILAGGNSLVLADAVTFIVSTGLLLGIRARGSSQPGAAEPSMIREAAAGFSFVKARPWIAAILLQGSFQVGFVLGPEIVLVPIYLSLHGNTHLYGFVLSGQAAGALIGAVLAPRAPEGRAGLVALSALLLVAPELVILAVTGPGWLLIISSGLGGAAFAGFGVLWISALQRAVPDQMLGRVLSLDAFANTSFQPLGIVLVPAILAVTTVPVLSLALLAGLIVSTAAPAVVPGVLSFSDPPEPAPAAGDGAASALTDAWTAQEP